jgi:pseudaminic acid synthase
MLNIKYLKKKVDFPVGFSDHSEGSISAIQAVSFGSNIFEKHITYDKKSGGPDSAFAANPKDLKEYVKNIHKAKDGLGNFSRKLSNKEKNIKKVMRRSAFITKDINKGDKLSWKNIIMQRPGGGLEYKQLKILIKKKINYNLLRGTRLKKNHFI